MPQLEADLTAERAECYSERQTRIAAEPDAAVVVAQRHGRATRMDEDQQGLRRRKRSWLRAPSEGDRQAADRPSTKSHWKVNGHLDQADFSVAAPKTDLSEVRVGKRAALDAAAELHGAPPGK